MMNGQHDDFAHGDLGPRDGGLTELEQLVNSAGDYVRPSRDFRPRVVELSRMMFGERRVQRRMGLLVLAVLCLATWGDQQSEMAPRNHEWPGYVRRSEAMREKQMHVTGSTDVGWALVEILLEDRQRSAEQLRPGVTRQIHPNVPNGARTSRDDRGGSL